MLRILLIFTALLLPGVAFADDWAACLAPHAPKFFYAADKSRNLLFQLEEQNGKTAAVREFACIHGRVEGDKQKEGDLKTPEGVYFITKKITQKLDFMEYGPHAVALNYPNPVDRLRGKTGGGIWLHSKGQPIQGITTRGCLAIDQHEIREIVSLLRPGTPIVVAERMIGAPFYDECGQARKAGSMDDNASLSTDLVEKSLKNVQDPLPAQAVSTDASAAPQSTPLAVSAPLSSCVHAVALPEPPAPAFCVGQTVEAALIHRLTLRWVEQREQRADTIFELYDAKAWPKASREAFAQKKERLRKHFRTQKEFKIEQNAITVLQGPGYWVSCFPVSYKLKDGPRSGLRALYWFLDSSGTYRIVGEAFIRT